MLRLVLLSSCWSRCCLPFLLERDFLVSLSSLFGQEEGHHIFQRALGSAMFSRFHSPLGSTTSSRFQDDSSSTIFSRFHGTLGLTISSRFQNESGSSMLSLFPMSNGSVMASERVGNFLCATSARSPSSLERGKGWMMGSN